MLLSQATRFRSLRLLPMVFFASGAASLVFETLWFRQAGLVLGSSIWSSSIVLGSFMIGLGLGNLFAARRGDRIVRPVRAYALLEVAVGLIGLLVVLGMPSLGAMLAPALAKATAVPWFLHAVRMGIAFTVLVIPSACMGATLPLLVRALSG